MNVVMDRCMDGCIDGWVDGKMHGWNWVNWEIDESSLCSLIALCFHTCCCLCLACPTSALHPVNSFLLTFSCDVSCLPESSPWLQLPVLGSLLFAPVDPAHPSTQFSLYQTVGLHSLFFRYWALQEQTYLNSTHPALMPPPVMEQFNGFLVKLEYKGQKKKKKKKGQ